MRHLILTGFMATGKSTVGPIVAKSLRMPFVDLDEHVERGSGKSIGQIFAEEGEPSFRQQETISLAEVVEGEPKVIAAGGGALQDPVNRTMAESAALIITLTCSIPELARRMANDGEEVRPLLSRSAVPLNGPERLGAIERLLDQRAELYDPYPSVSTENRDLDEITGEVVSVFNRYGQEAEGATYELSFPDGRKTAVTFQSWRPEYGPTRSSSQGLPPLLQDFVPLSHAVLLTDSTVDDLYTAALEGFTFRLQETGVTVTKAVLSPGESVKSLETVESIYRRLQQVGVDRAASIIGIGGGVVCDIAGFVASTYLRGLDLVLVPTTLLAQADAAIGGKTGVDFEGVKNVVGTFYPPRRVAMDTAFLRTLRPRTLREGLAEIVKIAFVRDEGLVQELEGLDNADAITERSDIIRRAVRNKIEVVIEDAFETTGARALLNFGHTVGHALEAASQLAIPHGECISMGMVAETRIAVAMGLIDGAVLDRLMTLSKHLGLPLEMPEIDGVELSRAMRQDKKHLSGQVRMVLLTGTGSAQLRVVTERDLAVALPSGLKLKVGTAS